MHAGKVQDFAMSLRNGALRQVAGIRAVFLVAAALASAPAISRQTVGVHGQWAAFRDDAPLRCYAVAAPLVPGGGAFASVANWPTRRVAGQLHLRLYRVARAGSTILLNIDGRVFQLVGRGADAWSPNRSTDRAIVVAMRTGVSMAVSARDENGNGFTHAYALTGAATAIDAATLACRRTAN